MRTVLIAALLCVAAVAGAAPPTLADLERLPEHLGRLSLVDVMIDGEFVKMPDWPILASYVFVKNALLPFKYDAQLTCEPADAPSIDCDRGEKRVTLSGVKACYATSGGNTAVRFVAAALDCMISARTGPLRDWMAMKVAAESAIAEMVQLGKSGATNPAAHREAIRQAHELARRRR